MQKLDTDAAASWPRAPKLEMLQGQEPSGREPSLYHHMGFERAPHEVLRGDRCLR